MPRKKGVKLDVAAEENPGESKNICGIKKNTEHENEIPQEKMDISNLSKFKFEKKPHVKIEFENELLKKQEGEGLWEPPHWRDFLVNLRNMRANNDAPVDSMGCHMCMDENATPKEIRFQSLISLMLSSQTKDQVTFAAMERLKQKGLNVDSVLAMSDEELGQLIYPVGFWKTKVKYIKKTTQTLKEQYDSDIPDSVEKLCKLNGVGPKMAHICMKVAWNKVTGIGVDTHVHRISNRIGWVKNHTQTPEDTRKALQSWLPFELWSEVNHLMVGFGQTICLPVGPNCDECLNRDICPSRSIKKSPKKSPNKLMSPTLNQKDLKPAKSPSKLSVNSIKPSISPDAKVGIVKSEAKSPSKRKAIKNLDEALQNIDKNKKSKQQKINIQNNDKQTNMKTDLKSDTVKMRKSPRVKSNQVESKDLKHKNKS